MNYNSDTKVFYPINSASYPDLSIIMEGILEEDFILDKKTALLGTKDVLSSDDYCQVIIKFKKTRIYVRNTTEYPLKYGRFKRLSFNGNIVNEGEHKGMYEIEYPAWIKEEEYDAV
ncbi:MAG: hypothetical protein WCJ19_04670 [bacterium]